MNSGKNQNSPWQDGAVETGVRLAMTCELVEELKTREGVEFFTFGFEERGTVELVGPCIILRIID